MSALQGVSFLFTTGVDVSYALTPRTLQRVVKGGLKDYTDSVPLAVVKMRESLLERHAFGGKVRNVAKVNIRFALDMTDAIAAEVNLAKINDTFGNYFLQHVTINSANGVFKTKLSDDPISAGYVSVNGIEYRALEMYLRVWQESMVPGGFIA